MNDMGNLRILKKCALTQLQLQETKTKNDIRGHIGIYLVTKMHNSQKGKKTTHFNATETCSNPNLAFHIHDKQGNT